MAKKRHRAEHDGDAFIRASEQETGSREDLSEFLGEEYLRAATGGEEDSQEALDAVLPEEMGGPFLVSEANEEFGRTVTGLPDDAEEERAAEPSAFPQAVGSLGLAPVAESDTATETESDELEEESEIEAEPPPIRKRH